MVNVFENMEMASCCCKPDHFDLKSIRDGLASRFKVIRTHKRQLPQFDYHMGPLYATDIVFEYDGQLYLLFANIVCEPYILAKWHRQIADVYPGLLKITDPTVTIEEEPIPLARCECGRYTDTSFCYSCDAEIDQEEVRHCGFFNSGYENLEYFGDPTRTVIPLSDGTTVRAESLQSKMKSWYTVKYDSEYEFSTFFEWTAPTEEFDRILFTMLYHSGYLIDSGK